MYCILKYTMNHYNHEYTIKCSVRQIKQFFISVSVTAFLSLLVVARVSHGLPTLVTTPPPVAAQ